MLWIKNARVIDPASKLDEVLDVYIKEGKIAKIGRNIKINFPKNKKVIKLDPDYQNFAQFVDLVSLEQEAYNIIIEAQEKILCPGFFDLHTHLREPGREDEETIKTGSQAAAAGGFTGLACMPNTQPPLDNAPVIEYILSKARKEAVVNIYPVGCLTKKRAGVELAELGELKEAGAVALSDDGCPVSDGLLMRRILEYAKMFEIPVLSHSEDLSLSKGGAIHEGWISTMRGLPGIPREAEEIAVARDVSLAALANAPIHIMHLSSHGSIEIIRKARERGLEVTCEVTPHHLILTEDAVSNYDTNAKVNPPLRDEQDREALRIALSEGVIDVIATDHAPHLFDEKDVEFINAAFGLIGLETALPLLLDKVVKAGYLSMSQLIERMAIKPRQILNLPYQGIKEEAAADLVLIDPKASFTVKKEWFFSRSRNTPFDNWTLQGGPILTILASKIIFAGQPGKKGFIFS